MANNFVALASVGLLLDNHALAYPLVIEFARCIVYVYFARATYEDNFIAYWTYYVHLLQLILIWLPYMVHKIYEYFLCIFINGHARADDVQEKDQKDLRS